MPPRSRTNSLQRRGGLHGNKENEEKGILNPTQLNELLLSVIEHHSAPVEVVEVASDLLLDRYIEFVSNTVLIRSYEGAKDVGPVLNTISANPSIQVLHYMDTDFFQFLENEVSRIVCVPMSIPCADFKLLVEKTFNTKIIEYPQMMTHIRLDYSTIENVWALVNHREAKEMKERHQAATVVNSQQAAENEVRQEAMKRHAEEVLRDSSALASRLLVMKGKNPSFYVDEFCLMFERHQPLASLQASLDRAKEQLREYDLSSRLSHAEPLALCLTSLLNILTKPMHPSLSDDVCSVAAALAGTLIRQGMAVVCIPHAQVHLSSFVHLLTLMKGKPISIAMKGFFSTFMSLVSTVKVITALKESKLGTHFFMGLSDVVLMLAKSLRESMEGLLPPDAELSLSANRLARFMTFDEDSTSATQRTPSGLSGKAFRSYLSESGHMDISAGAADGTATASSKHHHIMSQESISAIKILWPGAITTINVIMDTLDKLICEGLMPNEERGYGTDQMDYVTDNGIQLVGELVYLGIASLRCLWFLPDDDTARFLVKGTPSLGGIFRRMTSWVAALREENQFWFPTVQCAISHVIAKALAQNNKQHLSFIHHQWIIRICVACGPAAERAILTELHRFFCVTKTFPGAYNPETIKQVWSEVHQFAHSVMATTPSPSNARAMWSSITTATEAYLAISKDPFDPQPQRDLSTMAYTCVLDITNVASSADEVIRNADDFLDATSWDSYEDFFDEYPTDIRSDETTAIKGVSAMEMVSMGGSLMYVLDLLEHEKAERRWRSLGLNSLSLADALTNVGAPHSIGALFVHVGIAALAKGYTGNDDVSVLSLLCKQFESIMFRWVNVKAALSVLDAASVILLSTADANQRLLDGETEDLSDQHPSRLNESSIVHDDDGHDEHGVEQSTLPIFGSDDESQFMLFQRNTSKARRRSSLLSGDTLQQHQAASSSTMGRIQANKRAANNQHQSSSRQPLLESAGTFNVTAAGDRTPAKPQRKKPSVLDQLSRDYFDK